MVVFGTDPILECSSKGDRRFSAFYARIPFRRNRSIEELYQSSKIFPGMVTGLSPKEAKSKVPINIAECRRFYSELWDEYFRAYPDLLLVIKQYNGFSDIYGEANHACQAEEIYRIRCSL